MNSIEDIAEMMVISKKLQLQNGILVAIPNQDSGDSKLIQGAIEKALKEADQQKITGAATTPFLLKRVHEITEGASIHNNIRLVKHNALVGAQLAVEYHEKLHYNPYDRNFYAFQGQNSKVQVDEVASRHKGKLIVIGGSAVDY